jgi:hypothetical protein
VRHATKNTAGCCDGHGQVHHVASDDPHYEGALSFIRPCEDPECIARREAEWARECEPVASSVDTAWRARVKAARA